MKKHIIPAEHFMEQFHNHHHYVEHGPDERRPEWWELPEPRARGGRIDFRNGGRVGYADGGGIDQLLQNLQGSFSQLNQQVAAPQQAPASFATPGYDQMVSQALGGKSWNDLFPKAAPTPAPAPAAPAAAPTAPETQPQQSLADWWSRSGMDANVTAPGSKRGGAIGRKTDGTIKSTIVERALAATRRK